MVRNGEELENCCCQLLWFDFVAQVPEGTQPGDQVRLGNRGITKLNTNRKGDHYITFDVVVPRYGPIPH